MKIQPFLAKLFVILFLLLANSQAFAELFSDGMALVQETAKVVYRALGCRGLSRVDLFLKEDGEVVLNEVNTLPGMTSYSRYPRMMEAAGLAHAEVIDRLVDSALAASRQ